MKPMNQQGGVTLIEILVSIVIVCFGLLGVAGLITTGLKSTQSSQFRTQASFLAYDIAEKMRINRDEALAGQYKTAVTATNAIALADKAAWQASVGALPSGVGTVTMPSVNTYEITIQWDDSKIAGGGATQQFKFRGEL